MKISRSLTGIFLACAMALSSSVVSAATYYNTSSYVSGDAVSYVKNRGFMTGYSNGSFGEGNLVNRAEFAKVITLIYSQTSPSRYTITLPFRDTSNNAWYTPYIVYAYGNGFMSGYPDNTFHPNSPVTFSEAAKVLSMVYRLDLGDDTDSWYEPYARALSDAHAIPTSIYSFSQALTRGQLADIVYRLDSGNRSQSSLTYDDLEDGDYSSGGCDDIKVTIDPEDDEVRAGDTFKYEITVENCDDDDHRIDVEADLDHDMTFSSASDGGYSSGSRTVRWTNLRVDEDDETVITLRVRISSGADDGDDLDLTVEAEDDDDNSDSATETIEVDGDSNNDDDDDCYYDSYGRYVCDNNCALDCYYDYAGRYICSNNSSNNCNNNNYNNNCYYDSYNNYICNNNNNCGNNCYYDSHGRYVCTDNNNNSSCNNCYYNTYGQYICDNNNSGDVSVTLIPDTTQPGPGDLVRYTIRVRNNTSTDRRFTVRAQFSSDYTFVSGTNNVQTTDSRNIYWNNLSIDHYDTEELTLKLRVRSTAVNGQRLDLFVTADNGNSRTDNETSNIYVQGGSNNNNCYYDNSGRYYCNNNNSNCYYDSYGRYVCSNSGNLSVLLRADSNSVRIGDIVRTYITLNNNQNRDETVDLTANIDEDLTYYSASNSPDTFNNGRVEWDRLTVRANSTLTVTLDTRVSNFAHVNDQLRINVTAQGLSNTTSDVEYVTVRN